MVKPLSPSEILAEKVRKSAEDSVEPQPADNPQTTESSDSSNEIEQLLSSVGLSVDDAEEIIAKLLTNPNEDYTEDFQVGSLRFSLRYIGTKDRIAIMKLLRDAGFTPNLDQQSYNDMYAIYVLAASLVSFGKRTFPSLKVDDDEYYRRFLERVKFVESLSSPVFGVLLKKYYELNRKMDILFSDRVRSYFFEDL